MNDGVKVRSKREASDAAPALVDDDGQAGRPGREPQMHRTVDRVTQILEEVVYHPGMTFAEVARALGAQRARYTALFRDCWPKAGCMRTTAASISARRCTD
jgi:hypothetical protein